MKFDTSKSYSARLHQLIPGGCHTYAKGDDQFPYLSPGVIVRGNGSHVWDADGNEFIEYGSGLRAVTLGHAFPQVVKAAQRSIEMGVNFSRPAPIELECAESLLSMISAAEMVKFAKDGSSVTTAAIKLARAATGRTMVAYCVDHPFFAVHDWFIGTTSINAGIPQKQYEDSVPFRYNDPESLTHLFAQYPGQIACVMMEPAKYEDPKDHFLHRVKELCERHGALFILDEMITGFRFGNGGAQGLYEIEPDLSCFGKGMANGFALSALVGKRRFMEQGGLYHDRERVFLLSTTHGAETHAMAAAVATMNAYQQLPVIKTLHNQGQKLLNGLRSLIDHRGLADYVQIHGKPCNLVFSTMDQARQPSQHFRALLMQELIRRGILGTSLVVNYSHSDQDITETISAFDAAFEVYQDALENGLEGRLIGGPTQSVYRRFNDEAYRTWPFDTCDYPASDAEAAPAINV